MQSAKDNNKVCESDQVNTKLVRVTISLDPDDYAAFGLLGKKKRLSRSWLIRQAMREFLDGDPDSRNVDKF